ncbi:uncharacterized protein ACJ7VT_009775 [Polymixia lowei]
MRNTGGSKKQLDASHASVIFGRLVVELAFMTKRRAEDTLCNDTPSKRRYRSLCSIGVQLESMAASGGVDPPSLLALLGSRCRKRPYYFEEAEEHQETSLSRKTANCDLRNPALNTLSVQPSGSFRDHHMSATHQSSKKRPREDRVVSQTKFPQVCDAVDDDGKNDDCSYNSFQYWRVPLPELDLSLLEDVHHPSEAREKPKVKDRSSDAMET